MHKHAISDLRNVQLGVRPISHDSDCIATKRDQLQAQKPHALRAVKRACSLRNIGLSHATPFLPFDGRSEVDGRLHQAIFGGTSPPCLTVSAIHVIQHGQE